MRIIDDLHNIVSKLKLLKSIPDCPKGTDMPCIFCLECDKSEYQEFEYDDGLMRWTKNSAVINLKLNYGMDALDKVIIRELVKALASTYTFIIDKPEEGYDLSFFFFHTDKEFIPIFERIVRTLPELARLVTEGRMTIRNWAKNTVKKHFVF